VGLRKFVLAVFALTLSGAHAADLSHIGPTASAASLIAARGAVQEPALEFVYKIEGGSPGTITVDLAQDFSVIQRDNQLLIYDFALRRIITLDDPSHSFENASLYGMVDFFSAETYNRRVERDVLSKVKVADQVAALAPFWTQSQLHVMAPEDGTPKIDRRADTNGSIHFSYSGAEVASYVPSKHVLTKDEAARLSKFLRFYAPIHPGIIDDIAASGHLPDRLSYESVSATKVPTTIWTLQSAVPVKAAFPLLAGSKVLLPKFEGETAAVAGLIPVMQAAIAGSAPGRHSAEDYRASIDVALTAGKPFQAALIALELSEQYGKQSNDCAKPQGCHSLKEIIAAAKADPRMEALSQALSDTSPQKADAIKTLQAMKRDDLSNPYVLDEFLADDLVAANRSNEALPLLVKAIKGNPYLAGYYKDLGDLFRFQFRSDIAWFCYDLGRTLPGGADAPVISEMNGYEAQLAKNYPQFF
jgi:hypothetical protein